MIKPNLAKFFKDAGKVVSKHSPEILTGVGIVGMVTTTVLAVKATPKALQLIEERKREEGRHDLKSLEVVKAAWKPYIPAMVTGVTSMTCLIGASSVNARRNAALAAAYTLSETALSEYRDQVVESLGEKKEQTIREKISQKQLDKTPISTSEVYITGRGNTTCLDPLSKRYFKSDRDLITKAENKLNKRMLHDICGQVSLNEFYDEIGLDRTDLGDNIGWDTDHLIDLDITAGLDDNGEPCLVIGHHNAPRYEY